VSLSMSDNKKRREWRQIKRCVTNELTVLSRENVTESNFTVSVPDSNNLSDEHFIEHVCIDTTSGHNDAAISSSPILLSMCSQHSSQSNFSHAYQPSLNVDNQQSRESNANDFVI